jgi:hypothetical protein
VVVVVVVVIIATICAGVGEMKIMPVFKDCAVWLTWFFTGQVEVEPLKICDSSAMTWK